MHERDTDRGRGFELARRECVDRERWRFFYPGHHLGGMFLEGTKHQKL